MRTMTRRIATAFLPFALLGCGGNLDPPSPAPTSSPEVSPEIPKPPPPAAVATPSVPAPRKVGEPSVRGDTSFHLVVVNRARGTIPADVRIDGAAVVTGGFARDVTYAFDFELAPGDHLLGVDSAWSEVAVPTAEAFPFALPGAGERWGVITLSAARCDPCGPVHMTWDLRDAPPKSP
jgi:hypothetical protein